MQIKVCDAIMGSGKTSAAITLMNEHPDQKFIFITPYLSEAHRIRTSCPDLHFLEPTQKISEYGFSKLNHTEAMVRDGHNIATTHQLFRRYNENILYWIKENKYTLIIDESVETIAEYELHPDDLQVAVDAGLIECKAGKFKRKSDAYHGELFDDLIDTLKSKELRVFVGAKSNNALYWTLPKSILTAFNEVYVLTYLFRGQTLHHFFKINDLEYTNIGISRTEDGTYRFCDHMEYIPSYVKTLSDHIHILDNRRMNQVGERKNALSATWFSNNHPEEMAQLKRNIQNYYTNILQNADASERMWSTYKSAFNKLRGKGYTKSFVPFNAKATNEYRGRHYLVYAANVYVNLDEKIFFRNYGVHADDDVYALSVMVQWIWRSAIRDGEDIYIYIPSSRMRTLLTDWMNNISKGGDVCEK